MANKIYNNYPKLKNELNEADKGKKREDIEYNFFNSTFCLSNCATINGI